MVARSSFFSSDILGNLHNLFKWYLPSTEMCLTMTSHSQYLTALGIFHNVTTHVDSCYDSVLKFITLIKYAELSVHFKLEGTRYSILVDLNCLLITHIFDDDCGHCPWPWLANLA